MLKPRPLALLGLLLVAGLLALSGCGGDDTPQTKEGFILEADGVCEEFLDEFTDAGSQNPGTPREVADANQVLTALLYGDTVEIFKCSDPDTGADKCITVSDTRSAVKPSIGARSAIAAIRTPSASSRASPCRSASEAARGWHRRCR